MLPTYSLKSLPKDAILKYASSKATRVSLKQMFTLGSRLLERKDPLALLIPTQFLHQELPIRLAQSVKMLNSHELPYEMCGLPTFRRITYEHLEDIGTLSQIPKPKTAKQVDDFTDVMKYIQKRHTSRVLSVGQGLRELLQENNLKPCDLHAKKFQKFFDSFYTLNLGTRLLLGEHLNLHDRGRNLVRNISPMTIAKRAIDDARKVCANHFGREAPEVKIYSGLESINALYIEEHLHRILFEILKNSLRATVEFHSSEQTLPPLKLIMADGGEDVSFKLSDQGGGIPLSAMPRLWSYVYSEPQGDDSVQISGEVNDYVDRPLSGFGHGLPLARLTARYFGGDLNVVSMEGYGTDTYLHLFREDSCLENLPEIAHLNLQFERFVENLPFSLDLSASDHLSTPSLPSVPLSTYQEPAFTEATA
ncbi:alpha-ketoacid dehydrogenase kinase [Basidiobolus meristosporus CBS 931.73]|uniref:Protein-serine/threonine kinase n=1 Tax=Basidiobolus meristosporus CBS 931.73 TaxID=1314790 RepID=A0A1Y1YJQ0_9FUNG|nr:alpha-ketoacid dehydrogenase kinase [Basidiobolus meristosporus CBS 931.73]|eukprot:ORX97834.1 alpha-ketoacid dehydrogenase kinase [Basidiobolus meristosporus CBS 931.73]